MDGTLNCPYTRAMSWFVQILIAAAAIGSLFFPNIAWKLMCAAFFAGGLYGVLFPSGIMGWVKKRHKELNPSDRSLWWIPRFVGCCMVAFAVLFALAFSK
jgi:hypothetical protein